MENDNKQDPANEGSASRSSALDDFLLEEQVIGFLGVSKGTLDRLRTQKGFPFVSVTGVARLYFIPDIVTWLLSKRRWPQEMANVPEDNAGMVDV